MSSIKKIIQTTKELRYLYIIIIFTSTLVAALGLITPFLLKAATDTVVNAMAQDVSWTQEDGSLSPPAITMLWIAGGLLLVGIANSLITNIGGWFGDVMAMRMRQILSNRYYAKLLTLPQSYFDKQVTGTIISRLDRSIVTLTDFLKSFANNFFSMLITVALILGITAYYYLPLAILLASIFPIYVWLTTLTSRKWLVWEQEKNGHIDHAQGRFAEVVGQMKVVKSFVTERQELRLFQKDFSDTVSITKTQSRYWHTMDVLRGITLHGIFSLIYFLLFWRALHGHFSVGDVVLLLQLVNMAQHPASLMSWIVDSAQRAAAGSRDYFKVMEELPESTADKELIAASLPHSPALIPLNQNIPHSLPAKVSIEQDSSLSQPISTDQEQDTVVFFDHLSFGYNSEEPVIHDLTLRLSAGETVALVGESGGGKSTIINLLLGLYRPTSGSLFLCHKDVSALSSAEVRSNVGVVFQEASLFSGTIRENIAYARPDASEEEIIHAALKANAYDFISEFPQGLDTIIGERGLRLSGGQKQRIAVARAILKDAPILVLDEATSALDSKSERQVQAGLDELMKGKTTLVIAHRLSTIANVDTIVTLDHGRIDEIGSPADLAVSGGIYSELLAMTQRSSEEDKERLKKFGLSS